MNELELIDNISKTLKDDLSLEINKDSKLSIAAACFSIYAFQELKKQLKNIDELRFIFTSPTFTTEKTKKEKREFYIPRLSRERSLYGTEFEVKLRNELSQKAIAKECADWIQKKAVFKSNQTSENMMGFINVDDKSYMPINGLPPSIWVVSAAIMLTVWFRKRKSPFLKPILTCSIASGTMKQNSRSLPRK